VSQLHGRDSKVVVVIIGGTGGCVQTFLCVSYTQDLCRIASSVGRENRLDFAVFSSCFLACWQVSFDDPPHAQKTPNSSNLPFYLFDHSSVFFPDFFLFYMAHFLVLE
jgi:hypothetical protein